MAATAAAAAAANISSAASFSSAASLGFFEVRDSRAWTAFNHRPSLAPAESSGAHVERLRSQITDRRRPSKSKKGKMKSIREFFCCLQPKKKIFPELFDELEKQRDWTAFRHFLLSHRAPLALSQCNSVHVLEFLLYQVHDEECPYLYSPPRPPTLYRCPCPLRHERGSLDALVERLRAAFEENGGQPATNPFNARTVQLFLRKLRNSQARQGKQGILTNSTPGSSREPLRVVIHGYKPEKEIALKAEARIVVNLPNSIEKLFELAEKKFGRRGSKIVIRCGALVEKIDVIRDLDHLYIY